MTLIREILDEARARATLYGRRTGTVDVVTADELERTGFDQFLARTDGTIAASSSLCLCGAPDDCSEPKAAHP